MHVVGRDPGDEPCRQQHHDGGDAQAPSQQLRAHRQDQNEPDAEEDVVRRH
jgi:hypothetical protein